ncbi:MAG: hypothetical protein KatS3mg032_0286 [Cyclobacteriaceae bacterium]|nr:MAG: hypothetical protein KatS3mg032_0286 [Cyclobacteriaceae bacterium]
MIRLYAVLLLTVVCGCGNKENNGPNPVEELPAIEIRAADLSFLPEIRQWGTIYRDARNQPGDALDILKAAGCNTVRLRLWHTPGTVHSSLQEVLLFAQEIKSKGLKLWITVHYSDTWADPGQQNKPAAWQSLNLSDLADSVRNYSRKVAAQLQPDIMQAGNEINDGLLWPEGRLSLHADGFVLLLKQAIEGIRQGCPDAQVMVHYANPENSTWFFDLLKNENVDYDLIGLSYYARWHTRSLSTVQGSLASLAAETGKPILIAETAYPFTLDWADWTNNLVGLPEHLITGYSATQEGQYRYLVRLRKILNETPGGMGFCYWAPEWVAFKGSEATNGSDWENMALFDFSFKATEGLKAMGE